MASNAGDPLDLHPVLQARLDNTALIEASAGTGKTWTIVGLYLRLIVERALDPRGILVVTFTEAATAELKDRIRVALIGLRNAFDGEAAHDPLIAKLVGRVPASAHAEVAARVRLAAAMLDEAAVLTIHGFCRRLLGDHAFTGGASFDVALRPSQQDVLDEVARDFWRRMVTGVAPETLRMLLAAGGTPEELVKSAGPLIGREFAPVYSPEPVDAVALTRELRDAFGAAVSAWDAAAVGTVLSSSERNRNSYKLEQMPGLVESMGQWLGQSGSNQSERPSAPVEPPLVPHASLAKFTLESVTRGSKKGAKPVTHAFFARASVLADVYARVTQACDAVWHGAIEQFVRDAAPALRERKVAEGWQHYDDLLFDVRRALDSPRGPDLVRVAGERYGAALIDEFQDTDDLQYGILSRLFGGGGRGVFLVGDPKQAIYAFRGADVQTYLDARSAAAARFALDVNRRSAAPLVSAVNRVFGRNVTAFVDEAIAFQPALAADTRSTVALDAGDDLRPLVIWYVDGVFSSAAGKAGGQSASSTVNKGDLNVRVGRATAAEVARLLGRTADESGAVLAADGGAAGGAVRPVQGSDIAILVGTHAEAGRIREALAVEGIASVTYGDESVWTTPEADAFAQLLAALARPGDERLVRGALATRLFGWPLAWLTTGEGDPAPATLPGDMDWESVLEVFAGWSERLLRAGPMRVYRDVIAWSGASSQLLGAPDGERVLTNCGQIAELLQTAWRDQHLDHAGLAGFLRDAIAEADASGASEDTQIRLESDASLVRVMTIHRAKGLEFPVVFCPFLWDSQAARASRVKPPVRFHDPDHPGTMAVDFGSSQAESHADLRRTEDFAERVRVAYVALTRARERCYLVWGAGKEAHKGALAWLLHGDAATGGTRGTALKDTVERLRLLDAVALREEVATLARIAPDAVSVVDLPADIDVGLGVSTVVAAHGRARPFAGHVPPARRLSSFTSIVAAGEVDAPDHDAAVAVRVAEAGEPEDEILAFPRGPNAGSCLHRVMEVLMAGDASVRGAIEPVVTRAVQQFGLSPDAVRSGTLMARMLLDTPLDDAGELTLRSVPAERCAIEMEFHVPLRSFPRGALLEVVSEHRRLAGFGQDRLTSFAAGVPGDGYLKGYVDLVFEHAGRYWVVDYKSNWLGPTVNHYRPADLAASIAAEQYDLQYLLYSAALDRHLAMRVPDYSWEQHFGGVLYLYGRGVRQSLGASRGVHYARPALAVIERLRRLWPERVS